MAAFRYSNAQGREKAILMKQYETIINSISTNVPLIAFSRGGYLEGVHRGGIAAVSSDGRVLASVGDPGIRTLLRSCAKPFQLMTVFATGADRQFGFTDEELAVAAASHSGEEEHLRLVQAMLGKIGLSEAALHCGTHQPFMPHVVARMAQKGLQSSPIHNNCSGKHAAMLAACLAKGWTMANYESPEHPLQVENRIRTARFADRDPEEIGIAVDGCTVPSFHLSLKAAALAYARIADPDMAPSGENERAERVFRIMNGHPTLGSGSIGRLEAKLMQLFPGRLIAKVGAEAFFAVGIAPGVLDEYGVGLVVKLEDGITFNRACDPVVVTALEQLGLLKKDHLEALTQFHPQHVRDCRDNIVGEVDYLFDLRKRD